MLHKDRQRFVTASQAYRVMAGFEAELSGQEMEVPAIEDDTMAYIKALPLKPKVGNLKKAGFDLSGSEINEVWTYLKAITPVFSEGMESVAREIAMNDFIETRDESYKSLDMERGNEQEGEAVTALSKHTGLIFTAIEDGQKFLTKDNLGVTPDGVEYDGFNINSCAEVKNPKDTTHMKYLHLVRDSKSLLEVQPIYYWQAQCGLFVTDAKLYHWASYHNKFIDSCKLVYVPILRNEKHIKILINRSDRVLNRSDEIKAEISSDMTVADLQNQEDYENVALPLKARGAPSH